jgi:hypothetical protein
MHIPIIRLILAVIAAELAPILLLVATVAAFGPPELEQAKHFAVVMGRWIGPIAGAVCAYLAAYGIGRLAPERALSDGIIVGLCLAALDAVLLFRGDASFEWLYVGSNAAKVIAATLGGWLSRGPAKATPSNPLPTP